MSDLRKIAVELHEAEQAAMQEMMGLPGWYYKDLPRLSPEYFDEFVERAGKDNLRWITLADYGDTKRGQVMISPEGVERIRARATSQDRNK